LYLSNIVFINGISSIPKDQIKLIDKKNDIINFIKTVYKPACESGEMTSCEYSTRPAKYKV